MLSERRSYRLESARLAVEDDLILSCARTRLNPDTRERISALSSGEVDWTYVLKASTRHGVAPLVHRSLQEVTSTATLGAAVPRQVRERLEALYEISRQRSNRLSKVLGEAVAALDRANVPVLGLKDVQLAFAIYPDPALRPMGDIDLLVRREDYPAAGRVLGELGFHPMTKAKPAYRTKYAMAHMFHRQADNTFLDLQWNVLQREWDAYQEGTFRHDVEAMWSSARLEGLAGTDLLVPSPEHMLFHLCLHLEGHGCRELILFSDIVELVEYHGDSFDWEALLQLTLSHGARSSVFHVLLLTGRLFGLSVPESVLSRMRPAYLQAPLYGPLFGNLTSLHASLDEAGAVSPAATVLDEFEVVVRTQAVQAMNVFRELDHFATEFVRDGGRLCLFDGVPSTRLFPDRRIPAFKRLRGVIASEDLALARQILLKGGFREDRANAHTLSLSMAIDSKDPVLAGRQEVVNLRVTFAKTSADAFSVLGPPPMGNRSAALQSIAAHFRRTSPSLGATDVNLVLCPLTEAEIVAWICHRLGTRLGEGDVITPEGERDDRLFVLGEALAAAVNLSSSADLHLVREVAERHSLTRDVERGLMLAQAILPEHLALVDAEPNIVGRRAPRIFLWARYGPSDRQHPTLRPLFFYFTCLIATRGVVGKARFFVRSLIGGRGTAPTLPPLLLGLGIAAARSVRRGDREPINDAYWLEG